MKTLNSEISCPNRGATHKRLLTASAMPSSRSLEMNEYKINFKKFRLHLLDNTKSG